MPKQKCDGWDKETTIGKENLAREGLMHTGLDDQCQCVVCCHSSLMDPGR